MAHKSLAFIVAALPLIAGISGAGAAEKCAATSEQLAAALKASVKPAGGPSNGGLDNNMWAVIVARDGTACAIAFSGARWEDQWLGSRVIAAQKANTANAFSTRLAAFSTAQLYAGSQPGGYLFGIQDSNPVATEVAYAGDVAQFGTALDPMLGKRLGGVNVFAGGLALYGDNNLIGGLGVSGDTSCADHNVAWRVRAALGFNKIPAGPGGLKTDGIIYDIGVTGSSSSGFGHPKCAGKEDGVAKDIAAGGTSAPK